MTTFTKTMQIIVFVFLAIFAGQLVAGNRDGDALLALKSRLSDPNGVFSSWDPNLVDPCTWSHVTCDDGNRVIRLDLGLQDLAGTLAPELGNLDNLQFLELYKNKIEGTIPSELGNLKSLVSFDLYNNQLTGTIPSDLGNLQSLNFLRLNDNKLTGPIPQSVADIPSLRLLDLSTNDLSGPLPANLGHIPVTNFTNNPRLGTSFGGRVIPNVYKLNP